MALPDRGHAAVLFQRSPGLNRFRSLSTAGAILLLGLSATASAASEVRTAYAQNEGLDEVVVEGSRTQLAEIRQQMVALEDRFYERYNALNANDLFDIYCHESVRTGTVIRRRSCRAVYESRAHETEGRQHLHALQHAIRKPGEPESAMEWVAPQPAIVAIEAQRKRFRHTMLQVTSDNPELVELLRQRAELSERYEKVRRDAFGLKSAE